MVIIITLALYFGGSVIYGIYCYYKDIEIEIPCKTVDIIEEIEVPYYILDKIDGYNAQIDVLTALIGECDILHGTTQNQSEKLKIDSKKARYMVQVASVEEKRDKLINKWEV